MKTLERKFFVFCDLRFNFVRAKAGYRWCFDASEESPGSVEHSAC